MSARPSLNRPGLNRPGLNRPGLNRPGLNRPGLNRDVWLLFLCQALMNASVVGQVAMSALVGHALSDDKSLTTLPLAIQMTATMAASIPAGVVFARLGRRPGFLLGAAGSMLGSLVYALGIWQGSFTTYCLAAIPAGIGFGIAQHYRFAAAEVAAPASRPRAIALVMAGGVIAAILGPELVKRTKDIAGPLLFLGTYLCLAALPVLCAVLLAFVRLPPAPASQEAPAPARTLLARPDFRLAVFAGVVAYGSMNLIMASTPVEMMLCGYGVNDSADVIRAHAVAMYGPGFISGPLIQRFGAHRIVATGGALTLGCALMALSGQAYVSFMVALMLLGVGWNFMFTGATMLLSQTHGSSERVRAQATNDFIVFGTVACTAFTSGALHNAAGWAVLNFAVVPPVLAAVAMVLWGHRARGRQEAAAA